MHVLWTFQTRQPREFTSAAGRSGKKPISPPITKTRNEWMEINFILSWNSHEQGEILKTMHANNSFIIFSRGNFSFLLSFSFPSFRRITTSMVSNIVAAQNLRQPPKRARTKKNKVVIQAAWAEPSQWLLGCVNRRFFVLQREKATILAEKAKGQAVVTVV